MLFFFTYIGLSVGVAVLTCFLFIYEDANKRGLEEFHHKHGGGPWITLVRILPRAMLSQLIILPTYFIGMIPFMRHPVKPPRHAATFHYPVLLIHGLYHTPSAWLLFIWKLRKASWNDIYTFGYSSRNNNLLNLRELLVQRILRIASQTENTKLFLVGHSLGGLLARSVAGDPRCRDLLAGVVTLGAPHQGSLLGSLGFGRLAQSLQPTHEDFVKFSGYDALAEAPCLSLYSPVDNLVLPNENLRVHLPGWQEEETAPYSHVYMLYAPGVFTRVLSFLEQVQFSGTTTR